MAETDNFDNPVSQTVPPPSVNNASMSTPADGQPPRMQMYLFTNPSVNSADAADVVFHEYTHGLTNRSIGDGAGLATFQARSLGEGWSDWYALDFLVDSGLLDDTVASNELTIGAYLAPGGLRFQGADCPVGGTCPRPGGGTGGFTFGDLGAISLPADEVHDNGEIWLQTLWDLREAIGSTDAEQVITSGLRLSPNNPSFIEARDAILQADRAVNAGVNYDALWRVVRGAGHGLRRTDVEQLGAQRHRGLRRCRRSSSTRTRTSPTPRPAATPMPSPSRARP